MPNQTLSLLGIFLPLSWSHPKFSPFENWAPIYVPSLKIQKSYLVHYFMEKRNAFFVKQQEWTYQIYLKDDRPQQFRKTMS